MKDILNDVIGHQQQQKPIGHFRVKNYNFRLRKNKDYFHINGSYLASLSDRDFRQLGNGLFQ